jgi:hypothetical protein
MPNILRLYLGVGRDATLGIVDMSCPVFIDWRGGCVRPAAYPDPNRDGGGGSEQTHATGVVCWRHS